MIKIIFYYTKIKKLDIINLSNIIFLFSWNFCLFRLHQRHCV
jgi:hypothetical protein